MLRRRFNVSYQWSPAIALDHFSQPQMPPCSCCLMGDHTSRQTWTKYHQWQHIWQLYCISFSTQPTYRHDRMLDLIRNSFLDWSVHLSLRLLWHPRIWTCAKYELLVVAAVSSWKVAIGKQSAKLFTEWMIHVSWFDMPLCWKITTLPWDAEAYGPLLVAGSIGSVQPQINVFLFEWRRWDVRLHIVYFNSCAHFCVKNCFRNREPYALLWKTCAGCFLKF